MKNVKNTTKTILFASLIVAMIFPFSGINFAQADVNDNTKDKQTQQVEIVSKTILSEDVLDGVKVTHFKHKLKQTDFLTVEEYTKMNADYFAFLESDLGVIEGKQLQSQMISEFAKNRPTGPQEFEINTVKYGDHSITFQPYTKEWPWGSSATKDPINMVFKGDGNAVDAENIIDSYASHGWKNAQGGQQWVFVDETSHGGIAYWSWSGYQLEEGDYYGERYHLRLFNGGDDSHGQYGEWSVGAVHKENWNGFGHTLVSNAWEVSESHLKSDLTGKTGVTSVGTMNLSNSGYYQGIWNGGVAGLVTLS